MDIKAIIGSKFGRWIVIREQGTWADKTKQGWNRIHQKVLCRCECGTEKEVAIQSLRSGNSKSCGCSHIDNPNQRIHGLSHTPEHNTWLGIKTRCYNKKERAYKWYGAQGIKICDRWLEKDGKGFLNFLEDMGERPDDKNSIDRIDTKGDYCKENCRWSDMDEQANNKSSNVKITYNEKTQSLAKWAKELGMSYYTLYFRIVRDKLPVEEAFNREYLSKPNAGKKQRALTDQQALEIYKCPDRSEDIAKRYGIDVSIVVKIKGRKSYTDVTKDAGEPVKSARKKVII